LILFDKLTKLVRKSAEIGNRKALASDIGIKAALDYRIGDIRL
jgi:hypothetical protein